MSKRKNSLKHMEIWKPIVEYEGLYEISNYGRVKSLKRVVYLKNNRTRIQNERYLLLHKNSNGYLQARLCKNSVYKIFSVHRLVAQAFIPNKFNLPEVNHKDENKENNYFENLEWVTRKYNMNYKDIQRRIHKTNRLERQRKIAAKNKKLRNNL